MPQKIHVIYVLSPQISYDTKEQARTFDTLVLFVPYNEPYLDKKSVILSRSFTRFHGRCVAAVDICASR